MRVVLSPHGDESRMQPTGTGKEGSNGFFRLLFVLGKRAAEGHRPSRARCDLPGSATALTVADQGVLASWRVTALPSPCVVGLGRRRGERVGGEYFASWVPPRNDVWVVTAVDERDWGWVISRMNSRPARGSTGFLDLYAGAGPLLDDRKTGRVALCGLAHPVEYDVDAWHRGELADEPRPALRATSALRHYADGRPLRCVACAIVPQHAALLTQGCR
jgi:hypothetical protein